MQRKIDDIVEKSNGAGNRVGSKRNLLEPQVAAAVVANANNEQNPNVNTKYMN